MTNDKDSSEIYRMISSSPLFSGVDPSLLHGMASSSRIVRKEKGEVFLTQNEAVSRFYVMLEGWCAVGKSNSRGQESLLQLLSRGDFLPEPDLASQGISPFNVQALTPVKLLALLPVTVRHALECSGVFARNMMAASFCRVQELRDHIEQLTLHNARERVGRFLLRVRPKTVEGQRNIMLPFDKAMVASYLGIKPETLSRTLQSFKKDGFEIRRHMIVAPDPGALCSFCDRAAAKKCPAVHSNRCALPDFEDAMVNG